MYYLGIDLGGTNIAVGVIDAKGTLLADLSVPTKAERHFSEIVKDMATASTRVIEKSVLKISDIKAVGIGSPGSIDSENGICRHANNINMNNAPLVKEFRKYLDIPVTLENDANAAAYGEYKINGGGADSFVFITLGTGIGGGVIINGKLYKGFNGVGAELGHTVICSGGNLCTCGRKGCWEAYASVTALINQTRDAISKNPQSLMAQISKEDGTVNGKTAFIAAKNGDMAATEVLNKYFEYIGEGLTNIVNIFQPDKIVIGGNISKEGDFMLNPVKEYVNRYDYNKYAKKVQIETASLHGDIGIIGAALCAKDKVLNA